MPHPLRTSVDDFIHGLQAFEQENITLECVRKFMEGVRVGVEELKPYANFRENAYTRNLIYRDKLFEVMAICWAPGQKTTIHTHNGQLGWMTLAQGEVEVHNYKYVCCDSPENQNVVGMDCLGGAHQIDLQRLNTNHCAESSPVYCVDKLHSIHQIENSDQSPQGVVSLHVYSLPIDSCIAFDLEHQRCYRRTLHYDTRYGKAEVEVEQQPGSPLKIIQ